MDIENLIPNILVLLEKPTPNVLQAIFASYQRSVKHIDREESKEVMNSLKKKKSEFLPCSPALLLGYAI